MPQKLLAIPSAVLMAMTLAAGSAATAQTPADRHDAALAYAQCVRDNGYGEFPDPQPDGFRFLIEPGGAQRFEAAAAACRHLAPEGFRDEEMTPENLEALLKLAQCVRDNGVPDFPDPQADGRFDLRGISTGPGDARIEAAMAGCRDQVDFPQGGRIVIGG